MAFRRLGKTVIAMGWFLCSAFGIARAGTSNSVSLIWTTPGDDGIQGTATLYDIRYSMNLPINDSNFYLCPAIPGIPRPQPGGTLQTMVVRDLYAGAVYYFAMKSADERGNWSPISNIAIHVGASTVSAEGAAIELAFSAPTPNPARQNTRFELSLPQAAPVRVEAFDLSGRRVRTLLQGLRDAGRADVMWDLRDDQGLPIQAGVYLVRAILPGKVVTHRAVVVR